MLTLKIKICQALIKLFSIIFYIKFLSYTYKNEQRLISKILSKKPQRKALNRHQNLSEKEKNEKRQYGRERSKTLPADKKQSLVEYKKIL